MVRSIGTARGWRSEEDAADFEQEIIDQYALAMAAAGLSDGYIAQSRTVVFEFRRHLDAPLWQAKPSDADAFLAGLRRAGLAVTTRAGKAGAIALFYDFAIARYQGDINALTDRKSIAAPSEHGRALAAMQLVGPGGWRLGAIARCP